MSSGASLQPPQRALEGVAGGGFVRPSRRDVIERHRDVRAEDPLDVGGALGGEAAARPVDVALELDAVLVHTAESVEREYLEAA